MILTLGCSPLYNHIKNNEYQVIIWHELNSQTKCMINDKTIEFLIYLPQHIKNYYLMSHLCI